MEEKIPVKEGKGDHIYRTKILDPYTEGYMIQISNLRSLFVQEIYKIEAESKEFVFKPLSCSTENEDSIKDIRKEYELNLKCSALCSNGVVKPINKEEYIDKRRKLFIMEMLFEYGGESLLSLSNNLNATECLKIMQQVAETIKILEDNKIAHYDIKPSNIVVKDGVAKILDFGVSREFRSKSMLDKTTTTKGGTQIYSPPEVIRHERGHAEKIDIFCWGMTLYQILVGRSEEQLLEELEERRTSADYAKFLNRIKRMEIRGCDDALKKLVVELLLYTLKEDQNARPTFEQVLKTIREENIPEVLRDNEERIKKEEKKREREKTCNKLLSELQKESKDKYRVVKMAYNSIVGGVAACFLNSKIVHCVIGYTGARVIALALHEQTRLTYLNMGFCGIRVEGIKELADGLIECHTLRTLILGDAPRISRIVPKLSSKEESLKELANKGEKLANVGTASASVLGIVGSGVVALGKKFSNEAVPKGSKIIAEKAITIGSKIGLPGIIIGACALTIGGAVVAYNALKPKPGCVKIYEDNPDNTKANCLETEGTKRIAKVLEKVALEELDLSYCSINADAIPALMDADNARKTLKKLIIKGNPNLTNGTFGFRDGLDVVYP